MNNNDSKLPIAALERIDDLCLRFEAEHRNGQAPDIGVFLESITNPVEREALLGELIALDIDYRQKRGETPTADEYLARFPDNRSIIQDGLNTAAQTKGGKRCMAPSIEKVAKLFPTLDQISLVGTGGMGAVYRARQKGLDRWVALKLLPDEVGSHVKFALRFTREARALAKLNHPNIVSVFEFGKEDDTYYFLMEFVDGPNLRELIKAGDLKPEQALAIVPDLCDALQYAHDNGVVHRDIKPENILLDHSGKVKIADFGLSRLVSDDSAEPTLTATHQVMGTLRYMAPEQMEGAHQVDHRADIYSLGVVLYEMLTGELPIGRFSPPSRKVSVDVRLDEVVLKTLEKEPDRRYQHASDVKSDIELIGEAGSELSGRVGIESLKSQAPNSPGSNYTDKSSHQSDLATQELSARVLLLRRQLMDQVSNALTPLFRGQIIQMFLGILCIAIGVFCWARNMQIPHRLISGIIMHVYGVCLIIAAAITCTKIRRIDYSNPIPDVKQSVESIRKHYLYSGAFLGFSWWILWLPLCIALGADALMYPPTLFISLGIGVCGLLPSVFYYSKLLHSKNSWAQERVRELAGESLTLAAQRLDEMESTQMN